MKLIRNILISIFKKVNKKLLFIRQKEIDLKKVDYILINSLYFIGDTIFHTPVFELLRQIFPKAKIDIWIKSRNYEVVRYNPVFNEIIIFDNIKTADYNETNKLDFWKKFSFLKMIRSKKYDLYIDLTGKYSTALFALLGKMKYSAGINYHGFGFCYNKYYELDTSNTRGHLIDKYMSVVKNIFSMEEGYWNELISKTGNNPYLYSDSISRGSVTEMLDREIPYSDKPLICIHVSAGWKAKELNTRKIGLLSEKIITSGKYDLVLIGSEADKGKLPEIQDALTNAVIDINRLFYSLPLLSTIELIKMTDLFIGPDSAPLHISGAVGTPSIALFGPTNPEFSKPRGKDNIVVYNKLYCSAGENEQFCTRNAGKSCKTLDCMESINIDIMYEQIVKFFDKSKLMPKRRQRTELEKA
ncbi:MAG: glycosyltransferase family 9 protein [Ignavibacteria bacterium]